MPEHPDDPTRPPSFGLDEVPADRTRSVVSDIRGEDSDNDLKDERGKETQERRIRITGLIDRLVAEREMRRTNGHQAQTMPPEDEWFTKLEASGADCEEPIPEPKGKSTAERRAIAIGKLRIIRISSPQEDKGGQGDLEAVVGAYERVHGPLPLNISERKFSAGLATLLKALPRVERAEILAGLDDQAKLLLAKALMGEGKSVGKEDNKPQGDEEAPSTAEPEPTIIDTPPEPDEIEDVETLDTETQATEPPTPEVVAVVKATDAPIIEEPTPVDTPIELLTEADVVEDKAQEEALPPIAPGQTFTEIADVSGIELPIAKVPDTESPAEEALVAEESEEEAPKFESKFTLGDKKVKIIHYRPVTEPDNGTHLGE